MTTYTCENCAGEFAQMWSDEDAWREFDKNFPNLPHVEEVVRVCDDCYKILMTRYKAVNQ